MAPKDVRNLQDIRNVRLRYRRQGDAVQVRLTMLVVAAKFGDKPSLDLTDFTRAYTGTVVTFTIKPGSDAAQHFKELKRAYSIEEHSTKFQPDRSKNKTSFLDNGYVVMLNIVSDAYNGTEDCDFEITGFKILNKDPSLIKKLGSIQQAKITSLLKEIETKEFIKNPKNKFEIDRIIEVIRGKTIDEVPNKRQKIESEELNTTQEATPPLLGNSSNLSPFPENPLFGMPSKPLESQIPLFTQTQNLLDDSQIQSSQMQSSEVIAITTSVSDDALGQNQTKDSQIDNPTVIVKDESSEDDSEEVEEIINESDDDRSDEEEEGTGDDESDIYAIATYLENKEIMLDTDMDFTGYIIGIESLNSKNIIIGSAYKGMINTTNFELIISNLSPQRLRVMHLNRNCMSIEFRSKEQILQFFGYDDIDRAQSEQKIIQNKLERLVNSKKQMKFNICRKAFTLFNGKEYVWIMKSTIDELLSQTE